MRTQYKICIGLLFVECLVFIGGCQKSPDNGINLSELVTNYTTYIIEDCEYISIAGKYGMTHKGNCNNLIHKGASNGTR
jgi:hypothetical protein